MKRFLGREEDEDRSSPEPPPPPAESLSSPPSPPLSVAPLVALHATRPRFLLLAPKMVVLLPGLALGLSLAAAAHANSNQLARGGG